MRLSRFSIAFEEARVHSLSLHSPARLRRFETFLQQAAVSRHSRVVARGLSRDIKRFNKTTNLLISVQSALSIDNQLSLF